MAREGVRCVLKGLEEGFGGGAKILGSSWKDEGDDENSGNIEERYDWGCG